MADTTQRDNPFLRSLPSFINTMAGRQEAIHAKKLESALRSQEKFPINLEWMVDVFKYKHISSLTTHLKRHFKMNVHYKRFSQEQNKRVWTYFISVECFIGICEYVRHAARKKIANVWLRKVGVKGSARRTPRDYEEDYAELSEDNEEIEDEFDEEDEPEEDLEEDYEEDSYYYNKVNAKKRRLDDDDEEFQLEEEEEDDETYFREMEEEETKETYDSEDSVVEYDSSSSFMNTPPSKLRRIASNLTVKTNLYKEPDYQTPLHLSDGGLSTPPSTPPSHPSSPVYISHSSSSSSSSLCSLSSASSSPRSPPSPSSYSPSPRYVFTGSNGVPPPSPLSLSSSGGIPPPPAVIPSSSVQTPTIKAPIQMTPQLSEPVPTGMWKDQDWSYLHLRPNPLPQTTTNDAQNKYLTALALNPQFYYFPQIVPYNYFFNPAAFYNCQSLYFSNMDPSNFGMRPTDSFHSDHSNVSLMGEQFDTNMFLSIPEEHQLFTYQS